jgi:serine/threonine protein kinase
VFLVSPLLSRDIKLSNILYNNKGEVKLADFGLARKYSYPVRPMTPTVVTLWYRAPEILLGALRYSPAIDMWAIGCVFAELLLNKPLFPGDNDLNQIDHIFSLLGTPTETIWPELSDCSLVKNCDVNMRVYQQRYKFNNLRIVFPHLTEEGFNFLNSLLTFDPKQRVTVSTSPCAFNCHRSKLGLVACMYRRDGMLYATAILTRALIQRNLI